MPAEPHRQRPISGALDGAARLLVITIVLVAALGFAAPARAFPFLNLRVGGTPFEGPADWEATSIWWNPAALARVKGLRLTVHGLGEIARGGIARRPILNATGRPGDGADRTFPEQELASETWSGFGALTWNFNENVTVALGVLAPWLSCPRTSSCRSTLGGARPDSALALPSAYHQARESFTTIYFSGAAAFRVSSRIYIGVALSIIDSFDEYELYRDTALDGGSPSVGAAGGHEQPGAAQLIKIRSDGGTFWGTSRTAGLPSPTGVSTHLALLVRPTERLWIGASYQHVFPTGAGGFGTASAVGATIVNPSGECAGGGCWGGAALQYVLPDVWQAGARIFITETFELSTWGRLVTYGGYTRDNPTQLGRVIRLSGDAVNRGGAPSQIVIDHGLIPQFAGEVGVRWRVVPSLRLGASLIMTTSAVRQGLTSAAAFDAPKVDVTVGAEWQLARWLRVLAGYGLTYFQPLDVAPGDHDPTATVRCVDAQYEVDTCQPAIQGRGLPTNAARYTMVQHHLSLALSLEF